MNAPAELKHSDPMLAVVGDEEPPGVVEVEAHGFPQRTRGPVAFTRLTGTRARVRIAATRVDALAEGVEEAPVGRENGDPAVERVADVEQAGRPERDPSRPPDRPGNRAGPFLVGRCRKPVAAVQTSPPPGLTSLPKAN